MADILHHTTGEGSESAGSRTILYSSGGGRRSIRNTKNAVFSNSPPLRKGLDLDFEIETNVPKPFDVHWQVVNTGEEAYRANQLRGDFYSGTPCRTRTESTQYQGMHRVEGFIVKEGACVARTGEFVVNIE